MAGLGYTAESVGKNGVAFPSRVPEIVCKGRPSAIIRTLLRDLVHAAVE